MRDLFPGHYQESEPSIGKDTIIVFDTNVLLNLYRYPKPTSDSLLALMDKLAEHLWLPYHVALEYQRNRLGVIAEQKLKFKSAKDVASRSRDDLVRGLEGLQLAKRHSTIDPADLIARVDSACTQFLDTLEEQERTFMGVGDDDPIRERLDKALMGRIGPAPSKQESVEEWGELAKSRWDLDLPPGSRDANKSEFFVHKGLRYDTSIGDVILWNQLVLHCREHKSINRVVFVTDDNKDDWWLIVKDSTGPKRVGPRPELVEELAAQSSVASMMMYSSDRFLERFSSSMGIPLGADVVRSVSDVLEALRSLSAEEVSCPNCGCVATVKIDERLGASAVQHCEACHQTFHVHRHPDGIVTRPWGGSGGQPKRVHPICPNCGATVPVNFKGAVQEEQRYCMRCCYLLTILRTGEVTRCDPSEAIAASAIDYEGGDMYLTCPRDGQETKTIWGDAQRTRAVCYRCGSLLEMKFVSGDHVETGSGPAGCDPTSLVPDSGARSVGSYGEADPTVSGLETEGER